MDEEAEISWKKIPQGFVGVFIICTESRRNPREKNPRRCLVYTIERKGDASWRQARLCACTNSEFRASVFVSAV